MQKFTKVNYSYIIIHLSLFCKHLFTKVNKFTFCTKTGGELLCFITNLKNCVMRERLSPPPLLLI